MSKSKDDIAKEALDAVLSLKRSGLGITVGGGKTKIGLDHMDANYTKNVKFLVVAPKISIFQTWQDEAMKFGYSHLIPHMTFTTYLSLDKQDLDYDVVYLDEMHNLLYSHNPWLSSYTGKILGLSGTPPKFPNSEKGKMVAKHCPVVYTYDTDEAVEDEMLNDYEIKVHMVELDIVKNIPVHKNGQTWFASERSGYDYWTTRVNSATNPKQIQIMRVMRMKSLQGLKSKEVVVKRLMSQISDKLIIFADIQDAADRLCSHSYHSNNPASEDNLEMFKKGTIKQLSCVAQLSEGVNIPDLRIAIILHCFGNERKASQRIGRLMRLHPTDKATIHILCYKNTIDEQWVKQALSDYDQNKIEYI